MSGIDHKGHFLSGHPGSAILDFAEHKIYRSSGRASDEQQYSPAVCTGIDMRVIAGEPDNSKISTS